MKQVLIAAHDAGGAEILSSWVRRQPNESSFTLLLEGPAVPIFSRKLADLPIVSRQDAFGSLDRFDLAITGTGTGAASDLELATIARCRAHGLRVCAFLDHWTRYPARFKQGNTAVLPNELWTGDVHAFKLATDTFPGIEVRLERNPYFEDVRCEVEFLDNSRRSNEPSPRVLYVAEPIERSLSGYTDLEALEHYLNFARAGGCPQSSSFRIRKHPTEAAEKYQPLIGAFSGSLPIAPSAGTTLAEDISWADWVVGCDTAALAAALFAHRRVFSCIPAHGRGMTLPFPEIVRLFQPS